MTPDSIDNSPGAGARSPFTDRTDAQGAHDTHTTTATSATATGARTMNAAAAAALPLTDEIRRTVSSSVESMTHRAGDMVTALADAVRTAANELRPQNETLASIVDSGDATLRGWASGLRDTAPQDLARNLQRAVRRRPALFLAGALVAGVAIARVVKHAGDQQGRRLGPPSAGY